MSDEQAICPLCSRSFSFEQIENHVNDCLQAQDDEQRRKQIEEDERLADELSKLNVGAPSPQEQQRIQNDELFAKYLHQSSNHDDEVDDLSLATIPTNVDQTNVFEGVATGRRSSFSWLDSDDDMKEDSESNLTKLFKFYCKRERHPGAPLGRFMSTFSKITKDTYVLYGGIPFHLWKPVNDVYLFQVDSLKWTKIECTGNLPKPRAGHCAVVIGRRLYIHGGGNPKTRDAYKDMYSLDLDSWEWTKEKTTGGKPSARFGHSACHVKVNDRDMIYMYGGMTTDSSLDELLQFDVERKEWRLLEVNGAKPPPSFVGSFLPIQNTGKIVLFGGFGSEAADEGQTSLFIFNTNTQTWHWPVTTPDKLPRCGIQTAILAGKWLVTFGCLKHQWMSFTLNLETMTWYQSVVTGDAPDSFWNCKLIPCYSHNDFEEERELNINNTNTKQNNNNNNSSNSLKLDNSHLPDKVILLWEGYMNYYRPSDSVNYIYTFKTEFTITSLQDTCIEYISANFGKFESSIRNVLENVPQLLCLKILEQMKKLGTLEISFLLSFPNVEELDLSSSVVTNDDMVMVCYHTGLKKLNLADCSNLRDDGIELLTNCKKMEELVLDETAVTDKALLALLNGLPNLRSLSIRDCSKISLLRVRKTKYFTLGEDSSSEDEEDPFQQGFPNLTSLQELFLDGVSVTDDGLQLLKVLPNLKFISAVDCQELTQDGIVALKKANPNVEVLFVSKSGSDSDSSLSNSDSETLFRSVMGRLGNLSDSD